MARLSVSPARWTAFEVLRKVDDGGFSSTLLASEEPKLKPTDRSLCHELVLGVLRWQLNLDKRIEYYSNRKIESLDRAVLIALRLGLYQLRFLTRIPASAAVDESVKLVQVARLSSARAFVNAVLRRATREPDYNPASSCPDPLLQIAIETSHPLWLIQRWIDSFGRDEAEALAKANNETPPIAFRVVRNRTEPDAILKRLEAASITIEPSRIAKCAWRCSTGAAVLRALAQDGQIYFQDEASQLVAELVKAQPGDLVLDMCAAPGGKTTLIADDAKDSVVIACDISVKRLATVALSVARQRLTNVSLLLLDAAVPLPFKAGSFDHVLLDAPCSGTGTLRHNPEIRWLVTPEEIPRFAERQLLFLHNAAQILRSGGQLIYSTCSLEPEENEAVVAKFLDVNKTISAIPLKIGAITSPSGHARTWPHRHGVDGFFVAAFQKS